MVLYPFQQEARDAVFRHWEKGNNAALISMPTGSGKTIVFSDLLRLRLDMDGKKGLVLVHRDELLRQAIEKLHLVWPEASVSTVEAGSLNYSGQVTLGSVMSVVRHLDRVPPINTVVTDEAHHAAAKSWLKIYKQVAGRNPGWTHLGVTATPVRAHGASELDAVFGKPVYVKSVFELIVQGYLCPLKGYEVRTEVSVEDVGLSSGDFVPEELSKVINTRDRNRLIVENYLDLASERKALVFAADLSHARNLAEMFKSCGVNAVWISGETPMNVRRSILKSFRDDEVKVIVNCMVFTEGFDEPSVDAVLVARPTRSLTLYVQMVGRGLRLYPGKNDCVFIDFVDNSCRHRLISMEELLRFYQTKKTEKSINDLLAKELARNRQRQQARRGERSSFIDLSPTKLPLLVSLENLSSSVKEIDLFGLKAFAWHKAGGTHYVQVNDDLTLIIKPDSEDEKYFLCAAFPKLRLHAPLCDAPVDFDMAYAMGNAYLFDYGDRYLATRGPQWRGDAPSNGQRNLFWRLSHEVKELSGGSTLIPKPAERKGDYSGAITALEAEKVMLMGRKVEPGEAKNFIRDKLRTRIAAEGENLPITVKSGENPALELALKRAVSTFSESEDGGFRYFLKRLLVENQIFLDGNDIKISHVGYPRYMTEKQMKAARESITAEIRLYAPQAEVVFAKFPVLGARG